MIINLYTLNTYIYYIMNWMLYIYIYSYKCSHLFIIIIYLSQSQFTTKWIILLSIYNHMLHCHLFTICLSIFLFPLIDLRFVIIKQQMEINLILCYYYYYYYYHYFTIIFGSSFQYFLTYFSFGEFNCRKKVFLIVIYILTNIILYMYTLSYIFLYTP